MDGKDAALPSPGSALLPFCQYSLRTRLRGVGQEEVSILFMWHEAKRLGLTSYTLPLDLYTDTEIRTTSGMNPQGDLELPFSDSQFDCHFHDLYKSFF